MVNAQQWLDYNYPKHKRNQYRDLDISNKNLEGSLKLERFVNLGKLSCEKNKLTNLDVGDCPELTKISCWSNEIVNLDLSQCAKLEKITCGGSWLTNVELPFRNPNKLTYLVINGCDNLPPRDLSFLTPFTNLEELHINHSSFYGSLEPLKNMTKLKILCIWKSNIDSGLEYLPESLDDLRFCTTTHYFPDGYIAVNDAPPKIAEQ